MVVSNIIRTSYVEIMLIYLLKFNISVFETVTLRTNKPVPAFLEVVYRKRLRGFFLFALDLGHCVQTETFLVSFSSWGRDGRTHVLNLANRVEARSM